MLELVRVCAAATLVCGECCQQARSSNLLDSLIHACEPHDECEFIIIAAIEWDATESLL